MTNQTLKICSVVGARPNFIKIAPFCHALETLNNDVGRKGSIHHILVHTGQHYDDRMSQAFFDELNIPHADINLGIGSGSHAEQVGKTMIEFEKVIREIRPDWIVVVGDVNATCACSIVAKKEQVRLAHIEAGLRSFDMEMPEEINRLVTDRLSDLLFATDRIAVRHLLNEGVPQSRIFMVGNIMIDTLEKNRSIIEKMELSEIIRSNAINRTSGFRTNDLDGNYALVTLHRPPNVDNNEKLSEIISFVCDELSREMPVIWPIHPRTRKQLDAMNLWERLSRYPNVAWLNPLGYHSILKANMSARVVLTDSGGMQEECCVLGTPCLTLRPNTERPVTLIEHGGVSKLVGNDVTQIRHGFRELSDMPRKPSRPEFWDGHTAERIAGHLIEYSSR